MSVRLLRLREESERLMREIGVESLYHSTSLSIRVAFGLAFFFLIAILDPW